MSARFGPWPIGPFDAASIRAYAQAAGDDNPLHRDARVAGQAGFGDILVPGMLIMAHVARAMAEVPGLAATCALNARFLRPVLPGQALVLTGQRVALGPGGRPIYRLKVMGPEGLALMAEAEVTLDHGGGAPAG